MGRNVTSCVEDVHEHVSSIMRPSLNEPFILVPDEQKIIDQTETNMVAFRRTVYLTIQSSLDFEECAHKLLKMEIKPGYEEELCNMILDCCAQQRTYEKFFGLLAQVR